MQEQVFDVIHWADAQGKLADLVVAAQQRNPTNPRLQTLTVPPQPTTRQRERSRAGQTIGYVGQWGLAIGLVAGCQLVVVVSLVEQALDRFSAGEDVLAWILPVGGCPAAPHG